MRKNLTLISVIAVINALGYGIIIPVLYSYSRKFGLNDVQNGFLFSIFSFFQLISTPIIGRLSDKYGRKPLLIFSLVGSTISFFTMAFAPSAIFLFIARALDGVTAGNIPVLSAMISDTTQEKDRSRGFAILGASFGFGFVFGPAISSFTVGINPSLPFLIAGAVSLLATAATVLTLKETNVQTKAIADKKFFNINTLKLYFSDKNIAGLLIILFVYTTAFSMFIYSFQPFATKVLKMDVTHISWIFTGIGITGMITQLFIFPKVSARYNAKKIYLFSFVFLSIIFLLMSFSGNGLYFTGILMLMSLSNSFVNPLTQTFLSQSADNKSQGSILGIGSTFTSLGQIIGPIAGGVISMLALKYTFTASAILILICAGISKILLKSKFQKEPAF